MLNSTDNNQPWKLKPAVGSRPGSILAVSGLTLNHVHVRLTCVTTWLSLNPGRQGWPQVLVSGLIATGAVNMCTKCDPIPTCACIYMYLCSTRIQRMTCLTFVRMLFSVLVVKVTWVFCLWCHVPLQCFVSHAGALEGHARIPQQDLRSITF